MIVNVYEKEITWEVMGPLNSYHACEKMFLSTLQNLELFFQGMVNSLRRMFSVDFVKHRPRVHPFPPLFCRILILDTETDSGKETLICVRDNYH